VASGTRSASISIAAGTAGSATISLGGTAAPAAAAIVTFSPTRLDLGSVTVGQVAATRTANLTNAGSAPLQITGLSASPTAFTLTHNCPASLAAGASCTLTVGFAPATAGVIAGSITVASNAASSPNVLALSGTGAVLAPAALSWISGNTLSFPDTAVGSQSAPLSLILLNSGGSPALLQSFPLAGAASSDFQVDPSSTCTVGGSLAAGSSCTMQILFAPSVAGPRSATLAIVSSATAPAAATLTGNGISSGVPVLSLSPTAIVLTSASNQPLRPQVLVIGNNGAAPLIVTAVSGGNDIALLDAASTGGGNCQPVPFTLAPGASCTLLVNPLASTVNSSVSVASNASPQATQVSVTGSALVNAGAGGSAAGLLAMAGLAALRRRRLRSS
jgi:hypothetical protein